MYGFVHPITKQLIKTNDFYKRKEICDKMYNELGYNELKFPSIMVIASKHVFFIFLYIKEHVNSYV